MRSRRNPYTKSAVAFQKDAATHRRSFLDVPLKGLAFTERGFEKLACDTDELIGVTFRDGTQIVEYLSNVANTAILIESALMKAERSRDLVRIEFVFDPSQDFGLEVVKINARAYTLSARSPIAFATKALCTSTALDALYAIEGRDSVDPLLVWHLAEPLRFTDLAPAELKFEIHGGDRAAESAVETAAQIVQAAESLIRKTLSKVVQRPDIDPVAFTELPAALDLGPLRAAFAKFIVTAIGESVGLHEDWRQGLWSSLELFSDGRAHVRLTRFTKDFSAWGEGFYVQNVNARKQVGAVAALVGLICKERAPGLQFESVRVSLSRQQVEQPTVSIEVVGKLIELRFDGDARDALLTPDAIAQTIFNLLSTIPEVASQINQSSVTAAVTAWAGAGVVRKLRSRDFGPHLLDGNPTISQNLANSEYIHAFAHAVHTANVGTQIYVDSGTSAQAARELNKFPTEPDPFKSVKYAGADIYGGVLDTILLHPSAGCLILPGAVAYGARPKTPRMYYQLAASMAILGDIASAAYTKMSGRRAEVTVALHFQRAINPEVPFDATLRIPQQANDHTLAWSDSISTWTLTPDQMAAIGAYPTLVLEFKNPAELYRRMCAPGPFEATARAIGVILGVKAQRAAFPSFDVPAADLEMVESGGAEDAGALGRAVYAYQQEFERILLRAVGQNETLSPDAVADAQDRTTALHTLVSRCALALISLRGVRDKVVFSATADANIRSALDSIWGATCLTELTLTELRRMLARMRENQTLARLGQMLDLQVRALSSRIDSLNRELVDPKTSERAVVATEAEREVVVERLTNARRLTREFEQLASYVTALANEMPEFTQASAEVAAGEAVFKELSSPPVPKVVVPPSVSPDPLLPPSDPPSEPPPAHMPPLDVAAAYKEISMDARAHVTDVVELPALDDPDVEAVDCIALGELRWLVKSLRSRMAHAQTELELNAAGTYRFAYSALPGTRHVVGKAADGSYTVTIYIPARRDISRPDTYEEVLLALAAGMEELNTQQGFHTDGEEEPDHYDIYDELST